MQLNGYQKFTAILRWEAGRIGGQRESVEIAAATDNPIIRHPITGEPYIPGSSLKGKIRSLLEVTSEKDRLKRLADELDKHTKNKPQKAGSQRDRDYEKWEKRKKALERYKENIQKGEPCGCGLEDCIICKAFGAHKNTEHSLGPTRFIFREAKLVTSKTDIKNKSIPDDSYTLEEIKGASREKGLPYAEIKAENIINRHTNFSEHPRSMERVIDGSLFGMEIAIRIFEGDNKDEFKNLLDKGLSLLAKDYLGGSGSRGYGKVTFHDLKHEYEEIV